MIWFSLVNFPEQASLNILAQLYLGFRSMELASMNILIQLCFHPRVISRAFHSEWLRNGTIFPSGREVHGVFRSTARIMPISSLIGGHKKCFKELSTSKLAVRHFGPSQYLRVPSLIT